MNRFGLALSGGGFRAVLYHLGLVRFLRDAGILSRVTHISSVSGGSVIGAHLALNWDRYNGSPNEFDAAASELVSFVSRDVRNRIFRRFPLSLPLLGPRRLLGLSNRKLTRTGLLEQEYEKHLYGDTSLFQLPERPELHILATNLSEGCLCSFNRNGLLIMHRQPGHAVRIERMHVGLATVPMVVTASSAFPGFFPPVELTGADVGAEAASLAGRRTPTEASSTTSGSGCSAAWNGGCWRRVPCPPTTFSIFPLSSRHCARQASPARTHRCAGLVRSSWRLAAGRTCCHSPRGGGPAGQASRLLKGRARWEVRLPCRRPGQTPETARVRKPCCPFSVRFCASTRCTASHSSPG